MEKRSIPRVQPFVVRCLLIDGERRTSGYVTDISPRGAQVACDGEAPPDDTMVVVEVRFPATAKLCRLPARLRWSQPADEGQTCGLTFEDLAPEDRAALEGVIERIRRHADQLS
jgi:hypothetical protein